MNGNDKDPLGLLEIEESSTNDPLGLLQDIPENQKDAESELIDENAPFKLDQPEKFVTERSSTEVAPSNIRPLNPTEKLQEKIFNTFTTDPKYNNEIVRDTYFKTLSENLPEGFDTEKIRLEVTDRYNKNKIGQVIGSPIVAAYEGVTKGVPKMVEAVSEINLPGLKFAQSLAEHRDIKQAITAEGEAQKENVKNVAKYAAGTIEAGMGALALTPYGAAFVATNKAIEVENPELAETVGKVLAPVSYLIQKKYEQEGKPIPQWATDAGAIGDFVYQTIGFMGLHKGVTKLKPSEEANRKSVLNDRAKNMPELPSEAEQQAFFDQMNVNEIEAVKEGMNPEIADLKTAAEKEIDPDVKLALQEEVQTEILKDAESKLEGATLKAGEDLQTSQTEFLTELKDKYTKAAEAQESPAVKERLNGKAKEIDNKLNPKLDEKIQKEKTEAQTEVLEETATVSETPVADLEVPKKDISLQNETGQTSGTQSAETVATEVSNIGQDVIRARSRPKPEKIASQQAARQKIKSANTNESLKTANEYTKSAGLPEVKPHTFKQSEPELQTKIAETYPKLQDVTSPTYKETPLEVSIFEGYKKKYPEIIKQYDIKNYRELVIKSYEQLIKETQSQFDKLKVKVDWHEGDKNYESSAEMLDDTHNFKHLYVFRGGEDHTMLGSKTVDKNGLTANDKFRAVHDYFGHSIEGYQFGKHGEENAWIEHSKMFSPLAQIALSSETRGQNSFVNYSGKNDVAIEKMKLGGAMKKVGEETENSEMIAEGEKLLNEANKEFTYAEQKSVVLPPEFTDVSKYTKTSEEIVGIEEGNRIAQNNGFKEATHMRNAVAKAGMEKPETVQEITLGALERVKAQRLAAEKNIQSKSVEPKTQTENAVQKSESESVDARQQASDGKKMGEGNAKKETSQESPQEALKQKVSAAAEKLKAALKPKFELPEGTKKSGIGVDELVDGAVKVIHAAIDAGADIKQAIEKYIKEAKAKWDATDFPETELRTLMEEQAKEGSKKKKILTERAYEGDMRKETKKYLEEKGLTRESVSPEERSMQAEDFINEFGEDVAFESVKNFDVRGAAATSVLVKLKIRIDNEMAKLEATDVVKLDELAKKQADVIEVMEKQGFFAGEFIGQLAYEYQNSPDLKFNVETKIKDYKEKNKGEIPKDIEEKFRKWGEERTELKKKIADAEKRAEQAENKLTEAESKLVGEEVKISRPKIYGKKRIAKGLDDLAEAIGAKASIVGDKRPQITRAIEDIGRGLLEEGLATIENLATKIKEQIEKKFGDKIKFEDYEKDIDFESLSKDVERLEQYRTDQAKKRVRARIEEKKRKIEAGDFSKKTRRPIIEDTELVNLKAEELRINEQYSKEFHKLELKNRTTAKKWKDGLWDAWGLLRVLQATAEASFVGIQGLTFTMRNLVRNPKAVQDAFVNSLKTFSSEAKTEAFIRKIKSQEWYPELKGSKLSITEPSGKLSAREELFISHFGNLIWNTLGQPLRLKSQSAFDKWRSASPFSAFERASLGYLDTLRVYRWLEGKQMLEKKGITYRENPEAYKQMADVVNTLTGRASLGKGEQIAEGLTKVFFSPRNWASSFKTATPYAFYHFGKMRAGAEGFKPTTAQKIALEDLSIQIGLTTSMVLLAKAYFDSQSNPNNSVEIDPRSSDFGKIKIGDIRIDPWGGKIQHIVLTSRIMAEVVHDMGGNEVSKGGMKTGKGEVVPLGTPFKSKTMGGTMAQMAINKLSPAASLIEGYIDTEEKKGQPFDEFGNPYSFPAELKERLYPIYYGTIYDLAKDGVDPLDGFLIFYSFFGGGVNVYDKKPKKSSGRIKPPTPIKPPRP